MLQDQIHLLDTEREEHEEQQEEATNRVMVLLEARRSLRKAEGKVATEAAQMALSMQVLAEDIRK